MKVVIQRVHNASLIINKSLYSNIGKGLVVLLGVEHEDNFEDADWLASKLTKLRIFEDDSNNMNLSIQDVNGEFLVVSQFTLHAKTKKGNRPSFIKAAEPESAKKLYEHFINNLKSDSNLSVKTGVFGSMMDIELTNNGPVTIIIDSKNKE